MSNDNNIIKFSDLKVFLLITRFSNINLFLLQKYQNYAGDAFYPTKQ